MKGLNPKFNDSVLVPKDLIDEIKRLDSDEVLSDESLKQLLEECLIDPNEEIDKPPVCLSIIKGVHNMPVSTLGNFSLIIGKAKSKKTFLITLFLAAAIQNRTLEDKFQADLPEDQREVILFDTEQGRWHVQKVVKRICGLIGPDNPINFKAYALRKFNPSERLKLIEEVIKTTPNNGFIVIDGIKDLVTSINDEAEATMIASKLLKWTEEYNIHIMCVLHQNKGDERARGHIGTELQNKAETVLSVMKDEQNKNVSIVEPVYCRDMEPEPFAFEVDLDGMPRIIEDWQPKVKTGSNKRTISPTEVAETIHKQAVQKMYNRLKKQGEEKPKYGKLILQLKASYYEVLGTSISDAKSREYLKFLMSDGYIGKGGKSGTNSAYYYFKYIEEDQKEEDQKEEEQSKQSKLKI